MTDLAEKPRILIVDDEEKVLSSLKRQLRSNFSVDVCNAPDEALKIIKKNKAYAVVLSDYKMPKLNGVDFLMQVQSIAPETTRMMLTGFADLDNAMRAVNEGHVFRFMAKPCPPDTLLANLKEAAGQYDLVTSRRVLLEQTLKGSIELMSEITSLVNPEASARTNRLKRSVRFLCEKMKIRDVWRYEMAAMLSQIGCIILPQNIMDKLTGSKGFSPEESQMFEMHPSIGQSLISKLPRMASIGKMVAYQLKGFDGSGTPRDNLKGEAIPLGGRILKIALDYDTERQRNEIPSKAFIALEEKAEQYDPQLLYFLEGMLGIEARYEILEVSLAELQPGMILHGDVTSAQGALLLPKSVELDKDKIDRLIMFADKIGIAETIPVLKPS